MSEQEQSSIAAGTDGCFNPAAWLYWAESLGYEVYLVDDHEDRYTIVIERPAGQLTEEGAHLLDVLRPNDAAVERNMLALSEHLAQQQLWLSQYDHNTLN